MINSLAATCVGHGWGWGPGPWIGLFWLALWGAAIFFWVTRGRRRSGWRSGEAVLAERYARGEIDADDYRDRLETLRERSR